MLELLDLRMVSDRELPEVKAYVVVDRYHES